MIELLKPLGLLGLLGIVVLIIIYIIKPNFQQKFVSSTFVWKLSLKYRKKRIPISKLRNILLIICQVLILTGCALILTNPVEVLKKPVDTKEAIVILDASASMRTELEGETRFERAVDQIITFSDDVLTHNGVVSLILADDSCSVFAERITFSGKDAFKADLKGLLKNASGDLDCSYGSADVSSAIQMCEQFLAGNPNAEIYLYTDTTYTYVPEEIQVVNVAKEGEWNAAILNAEAVIEDGYYVFNVDVACYGEDREIVVELNVDGANAKDSSEVGMSLAFTATVPCSEEKTQRVIFISESAFAETEEKLENVVYSFIPDTERIASYQQIFVMINQADSYYADNSFQIYGGQKEVVRVQYASSDPNPFFRSTLDVLAANLSDKWEIDFDPVKKGAEEDVKFEGYDIYIFEHEWIPQTLPTDGIVILADPLIVPEKVGLRMDGVNDLRGSVYLEEEEKHPLTSYLKAEDITISKYNDIKYDSSYEVLMSCNGKPVLTVREMDESRIIVMGFSLHYSNIPIRMDLPAFMYSVFEYFMPSTVEKNAFEVNDTVSLKARGTELTVYREGVSESVKTFGEFPANLRVYVPGTYVMEQVTFAGKEITEYFYVKTPAEESNIWKVEDGLDQPPQIVDDTKYNNDLLLYIAAAIVAFLFIEWWLKSRESA